MSNSDLVSTIKKRPGPGVMLPVDISDALDGLKAKLSHSSSGITHILETEQFIRQCLLDISPRFQAKSFLFELLPSTEIFLVSLSLSGLAPEELIRISDTFQWAAHTLDDDPHGQLFRDASVHLQQSATCLLAFLGSPGDAARILEKSPSGALKANVSKDLEPDNYLRTYVRVARPEWTFALEMMIQNWQTATKLPGSTCLFPVVSVRHANDNDDGAACGQLRSLSLSFYGRSEGPDKIEFLALGVGDSLSVSTLQAPIQAARQLLASHSPGVLDSGYCGAFRFSQAELIHSGRSANLAISALYIIEGQRFSEQRTQTQINSGVVLSGDIDASGDLLEVDPGSISGKVKAAFFSPVSILVFPHSQVGEARKSLRKLNHSFPERHLQIVGIETLADLFSDRRLVLIKQRNLFSHVAYRIWNRRASVIPSFLLLCLVVVLIWNQFLGTDMHPEAFDLDTSGINVMNEQGDQIGYIPLASHDAAALMSSSQTVITMGDINGDGFKDIVWLQNGSSSLNEHGSVVAWDGRFRKELWSVPTEYPMEYIHDPTIVHGRMNPNAVLLSDVDNDGFIEIFVAARHLEYYPTVLIELSALTGEVLQRYDHPGNIGYLIAYDMDGDGIKEILFGGTSNPFGKAVVGILDAQSISGSAPAERYYVTTSGPSGNEKAYIGFLYTPLHAYSPSTYPSVRGLRVNDDDGVLSVELADAEYVTPSRSTPAGIIFHLDLRLKPVNVGTFGEFDKTWEQALAAGYVDAPLSGHVKTDMLDLALLKTEDGWVKLSGYDVWGSSDSE